jgi:hypothetical protein
MSFEGADSLGGEPDASASSFNLGLGEAMAATFANEGKPH